MSNRKSIAHMFSKILSNGGATLALVLGFASLGTVEKYLGTAVAIAYLVAA